MPCPWLLNASLSSLRATKQGVGHKANLAGQTREFLFTTTCQFSIGFVCAEFSPQWFLRSPERALAKRDSAYIELNKSHSTDAKKGNGSPSVTQAQWKTGNTPLAGEQALHRFLISKTVMMCILHVPTKSSNLMNPYQAIFSCARTHSG